MMSFQCPHCKVFIYSYPCCKCGITGEEATQKIRDEFQKVLDDIHHSIPCPHAAALATVTAEMDALKEDDGWIIRAKESFANGTCPCCFCTDEGPHKKGCMLAEMESELDRLRETIEWVCEQFDETSGIVCELRRRASDKEP